MLESRSLMACMRANLEATVTNMDQVKKPLVSVIVPTKDSEEYLEACLYSIREQSYEPIELIVVDNYSQDRTRQIAERLADIILMRGPERSAQVNYAVENAKGEYIYKVDSDFVLDPDIVSECVNKMGEGYDAVIVHNSPDSSVGWIARIRKFEVDMYKYDLGFSSARFIRKSAFFDIDGFTEEITAGEDYDFQNKLNRKGFKTGFIEPEAIHPGEPRSFWKHMYKYYDYGKDFVET